MRKLGIVFAALLAGYPSISSAQTDPDWARREMERMQAQQERFDAQVARQRNEQERMQAQQERQAAQVARQRAEQEREAARQSGGGTSVVAGANTMTAEKFDKLWAPITLERLDIVFKVAAHVCPNTKDPHAFEDAASLMSNNESGLLAYFCAMYIIGGTEKAATKSTRAKGLASRAVLSHAPSLARQLNGTGA